MRPPRTLIQWRPLLLRHPPARLRLFQHNPRRNLLTLAIETSCDDTCVAVLSKHSSRATLHFNRKITSDHRAYGGVWPPVALRSHDASLAPLIAESLSHLPPATALPTTDNDNTLTISGVARQKPDFVAVTRGPGMSANLATGLSAAKGLAVAWGVPLLAVNHMQAHALTPRLVAALAGKSKTTTTMTDEDDDNHPAFPFLTLLVSGGHTQLVHSSSLTTHRILANTIDVAVGDALDKAARDILPPEILAAHGDVMYGALLERFAFPPDGTSAGIDQTNPADYDYEYTPPARRADEVLTVCAPAPYTWKLTPPMQRSRQLVYAFAGLGSQLRRVAEAGGADMTLDERRALARAAMRLIFEHLASRVFIALDAEPGLKDGLRTLVVSGGVASNRFLMHVLRGMLDARGFGHVEVTAPPAALCTDNAAMIAWTGMEMYEAGWETALSVSCLKKWSVDPASDEGGILGIGGWLRRDREKSS
ncbi:glycoprotease [Colletotrichum karsti]|uniref:N(6)-L-threonylcarbamoyladenine synthase n=1 Tax=Colletotrichum karsti TaxID=1095194 RepID=A0A9P6IIH7_9PEZI|nr:glycoprotease [Colletotrichum karsti]KAF9880015.1 glycoprotease [Colletotrichum karsti]